jgi:hypothetical protein
LLFVAGCTVDKNDKVTNVGVPAGSVQVDESRGEMNYQADHTGEAYVYDATDDRLVYERPITQGDRLIVDPQANRITLNDSSTGNHKLDPNHVYRIYFFDRTSSNAKNY